MADEAGRPEELKRLRKALLARATPLYRDKKRKSLAFTIAVLALIAAAIAWHRSLWLTTLFVLVGFLSWAFGETARKARCPACKAWVRLKGLHARCEACGQESAQMRKHLVPIGPGFIGDAPFFRAAISELCPPMRWQWPWPGSCVLCGQPAVRQEELAVHLAYGRPGPGFQHTYNYRFPISHCSLHSNGVTFLEADHRLEFRSFDYWNAFLELNRERPVSPPAGSPAP